MTAKSKIEIEDLLTYRYPSNLQYNPNGACLAFECAQANSEKNTYRRDVYLYQDGEVRQLTQTLDASILFWQDDAHLVLRRNREDHEAGMTDLFRIDVRGGEAQYWRSLPFPLVDMKQINEDSYVCMGMIDKNDADAYLATQEQRQAKLQERKNEKDYQVVDEVPYVMNGQGFINGLRGALFLVNGEKIKRLTEADMDVHEFLIHEDRIIFTAEKRTGFKADHDDQIFSMHVSGGKKKNIFVKEGWSVRGLVIRDGKLYAQMTDHKAYGTNQTPDIYLYEHGKATLVHTPDRALHNSVASDVSLGGGKNSAMDGNSWLTLASEEDHTQIRSYSLSWRKKVLFDEPGSILCMDARNGHVAFVYSDANHLFEVYVLYKGEVQRLTDLNTNALKGKYIAAPKRIDYVSGEDSLHGWILYPKDFDRKKKYPAILDIHGGPRVLYGENFFHEMQVWASKGYFVFFTNIRGSDGRGDAFADIRDRYGTVDYENLMDFCDAVIGKVKQIDPKKIGVTGGSYGGFMTNWIIGHTDRFCCAVSQRSIANWISKATTSDIGLWFNTEQQGADSLYTGWEKLWSHSPLKYVEGCKTPTLFIHSDEDYRCPLSEGMQMMQALAFQNVETRMVIFHGENHNLSRSGKPQHRVRRLQEMTEWFDKHCR